MEKDFSHILRRLSIDVEQYCSIIREVLHIDVCITDEGFEEIVTPVLYNHNLDRKTTPLHSSLLRKAVESGSNVSIIYPKESEECAYCSYKSACNIYFQLSVPIRLKSGELIGAIGLVGATEEQERQVRESETLIATLLVQFAELLASKAELLLNYEKQERFVEQLNFTLDNVGECIITCSDHGRRIESINRQAEKIFQVKGKDLAGHMIEIERTGADYVDYTGFRLRIDGRIFEVVGTMLDVPINNRKIVIFHDINALQLNIMKAAATTDKIEMENIIGESEPIVAVKRTIRNVAKSNSNIIVLGESGTGKELVARAIHDQSNRKAQPFVAINCAAIPASLLESELFGYTKGAFTGANPNGKIGKIELANKGTLFLDETGDMPLFVQAKVLRVLEEREIVRIGGNQPIKVDIRIISATNRDLKKMVRERLFRDDLYYRLYVIPVNLPPLRERSGDIRRIADFFLKDYSEKMEKKIKYISQDFYDALEEYSWPGNVRELRNIMEYIINIMDDSGQITLELLGNRLTEHMKSTSWNLKENEQWLIRKALQELTSQGYSNEQIAEKLGIGIATLYRKMKELSHNCAAMDTLP